jgi:SAM-dependent methyltransferase
MAPVCRERVRRGIVELTSTVSCLVCSGALAPERRLPGLLRCSTCGFVTADVALSDDELRALYSEDYFHGSEYSNYLADRSVIEKQFRIRTRSLSRFLPPGRRRALFEIGCAYGFFLSVAKTEFQIVSGIDISEAATAWARANLNVDAHCGDFLDHQVNVPPDAICLWDTVEHLARPDLYIERAAHILQPGGIVAVTTGDIDSLVARFRGKRWRQIHPPTHLHYFSKTTLGRLLERNGLKVCYSGSDGMYRSLDTMAHIMLKQKHSAGPIYDVMKSTGILKYDMYLNLGDIMFLIARKV